jgi:hypothetical protein
MMNNIIGSYMKFEISHTHTSLSHDGGDDEKPQKKTHTHTQTYISLWWYNTDSLYIILYSRNIIAVVFVKLRSQSEDAISCSF